MQKTNEESEFYNSHSCYPVFTDAFVKEVLDIADFKAGERVLDAGCGDGFWSRVLSKLGCETVGIDISDVAVKVAKEKSDKNQTFIVADLLKPFPFPKDYFDAVIIGVTLHHFPSAGDLSNIALNIYSCLKDNGKVVVIEPNGSNPVLRISRIFGRYLVKFFKNISTENETFHSTGTYIKAFSDSGFALTFWKTFQERPIGEKLHPFIMFLVGIRYFLNDLTWKFLPNRYGGNEVALVFKKLKSTFRSECSN